MPAEVQRPPDGEPTTPPPDRPAVPPLRNRLISAGVWSLVGRAAAIGLFFLTDMVLTRALSKGQFAAFYLATQATVFFAGVASLGTPQILSRTIRQLIYGPRPELAGPVIRNCGRILALGCAIASVAFWIITPQLVDAGERWSLFRDFSWGILAWSCLAAACLNSAFALQGLDDFRHAALVGSRRGGLLPNLAFAAFVFAAWQLGTIDLKTLVLAQVVFQAATLAYSRWAVRRRLHQLAPPGRALSTAAGPGDAVAGMSMGWYLKEGLPFFVSMLVTLTIDELDGFWVGHFTDEVATADYAAAKRLVRLMTTPYVMFALSLAPFAAELLAQDQRARLEKILRAATTLVSLPMLAAFAAFLAAPGPLLALAFGEKFRDAAPILQLLTIGQVVFVLLGFSSQVLLMSGRQRTLMYCSLGALVGYCALTPLATIRYGAAGAAAVQSAAFIGQAIVNAWLAKRQVGVWTAATLRPTDVLLAAQFLLGRRRRRNEDDDAATPTDGSTPPPDHPDA